MTGNSEKDNKRPAPKSEKKSESGQSVYIFDPETDEWKVYNPSGSVAYNVLSRDEWGWLD
jgi:hypothetical protein